MLDIEGMQLLHEPLHGFPGQQNLDDVSGRRDGRGLRERHFRDANVVCTTFENNSGQFTRNTNAHLHDHVAASSDSYQPSFRPAADGAAAPWVRRRPGV
ncbi:hypothetical protein NicSoilC12_06240 [Arthrobacter sp. NicSoilC12]|nr:hypothetical protein NicSoilC12_06240 [Arthrobacter sp. NicSoilC12]